MFLKEKKKSKNRLCFIFWENQSGCVRFEACCMRFFLPSVRWEVIYIAPTLRTQRPYLPWYFFVNCICCHSETKYCGSFWSYCNCWALWWNFLCRANTCHLIDQIYVLTKLGTFFTMYLLSGFLLCIWREMHLNGLTGVSSILKFIFPEQDTEWKL